MNNFSVLVFGAAVAVAAAWPVVNHAPASRNADDVAIIHATDAAYRDGLYLGRLDGQTGRRPHLAIGRWSQDADRNSFRAGYSAGYIRATITVQR